MDKYDILCRICLMQRAETLTRLQRLDLLTSRLKSDEPLILRELAEEFGVSTRTLSRDIEILRERGLPIEADRGRGGGIRLHWSWGIGRINLSYGEAVDLLVSLAVAEQMNSPILTANLAPIRRKLMASFSPTDQYRVKRLKSRILIGQTASLVVQTGYDAPSPKVIERLHQAFLMTRPARIKYKSEQGQETTREVEPHYLLLNYPVWYALCWDRLREDIRTFRCDRMMSIVLSDESFAVRPYSQFEKALEGVNLILP